MAFMRSFAECLKKQGEFPRKVIQVILAYRSESLLCILMWLNLYYMHYEVYISRNNYAYSDGYSPFFFMCYDVLAVLLFFEIILLGKRKIAFSLAYVFLFFFVVANLVYSRFLGQYLPLHALGETDNFHGIWWISYLFEAFRWKDLFVAFNVLVSVILIRKLSNQMSWHAPLHILCSFLIVSIVYVYTASRYEQVSLRSYKELSQWNWPPLNFKENKTAAVYIPDATIFQYGIIEGQIVFGYFTKNNDKELNEIELTEISNLISERCSGIETLSDTCRIQGRSEIVMIILESGMSCAVDECIEGKYVMPRINKLIRDSATYYNPHMKSNRGAGQSSDAQVSYFTGLIPLKSEFSILRVLKDSVVALPSLLTKKGYTSCITIPNNENFWHQKELNAKYGFTRFYALGTEDNKYWCKDDELIKCVMQEQKQLRKPFFHVILTLSMHGPYEAEPDFGSSNSDFKFPDNYSKDYCHYLEKCNYTDEQIGKYIDFLHNTNRFDNTVIVIVSDHEADISMPKEEVSYFELPLLIVNSGIDKRFFSNDRCNQVDLFPTLLDILGIESNWRGVGNSLLRKNDSYELTEKEERISTMILQGNYFGRSH